MSLTIKYNSRRTERTDRGLSTTVCWAGSRSEIETFAAAERPGAAGEYGTLESVLVSQDAGGTWCCERRYLADQNGELPAVKPSTEYGKKSASLRGSMLSMPLESNPEYLTCWDHYLAAAPGVTAIPEWWETAKDPIIVENQKYAWIKSLGETPVTSGAKWKILKKPVKPGLSNYDLAVYSVTETARFRTPEAAGRMVAGNLNRIGSPEETFGITGGDWKCDDATVSYRDGAWFATLTWTRSGNDKGWDKDLYNQGN